MTRPVVFLDDGGVMNDNARRGAQWRDLVGAFFAPILGGTPAAWAAANMRIATALFDPTARDARLLAADGYAGFDHRYHLDWLADMCAEVGVACPPEDKCVALARHAASWIIPQVRAAYPGAVEAIQVLHARGYRLHTASGEPSGDLAGYLDGMGVRHGFGRLYGPDLIDTFENGPLYYERLLHDAGVAPDQALIVDDRPSALAWATQLGARTVPVRRRSAYTWRDTVHWQSGRVTAAARTRKASARLSAFLPPALARSPAMGLSRRPALPLHAAPRRERQ